MYVEYDVEGSALKLFSSLMKEYIWLIGPPRYHLGLHTLLSTSHLHHLHEQGDIHYSGTHSSNCNLVSKYHI